MSIFVDETLPLQELSLPFPPRDVQVRRNAEVREMYSMGEEIGRGKFGIVYRCTDKETGRVLAAKFVATPRRDDKRDVEREVEIMNYLQHPGIIQIYDAFDGGKEMALVMELVEGGELFDRVIEDDYILTEKACAIFIRQVCAGVGFMHQKNVLHLDMKPENILCLSKTGNRIKIIDFGLARRYDPTKKLQVLFGTPEFVAPEVVNFDAIGYPTDMWSVGVIAYVLVSGLSPFMGDTDCETMANVTIAKYDFDDEAFDDVSDECKEFIAKILIKDKSKRLTSEQALAHRWLNMKASPVPSKVRSRQASLAEAPLEAAQLNLTQFVERWMRHPSSPYAFSDGSAELVLSRVGSAASVGLCSPSGCESLTSPELSSEEASSSDGEGEAALAPRSPDVRPQLAGVARVCSLRREESLKRARGRLVHQASKEEHYISIDQVKTLKQQGSLDEMVLKVANTPSGSRRGSVTQPPAAAAAARLRPGSAGDGSRPQPPSPLASQPASSLQLNRAGSPGLQVTVCDQVMRDAAAALAGAGPQRRPTAAAHSGGASPRQLCPPASPDSRRGGELTPSAGRTTPSPSRLSRTGSPLATGAGGSDSVPKDKSPSPRPSRAAEGKLASQEDARAGSKLSVAPRSRTPSVTVTGAAERPLDTGGGRAEQPSPTTRKRGGTPSKAGSDDEPRKSPSKSRSPSMTEPSQPPNSAASNQPEAGASEAPARRRRRPEAEPDAAAAAASLCPESADTGRQRTRRRSSGAASDGAKSQSASPVPARSRKAADAGQPGQDVTGAATGKPVSDGPSGDRVTAMRGEASPSQKPAAVSQGSELNTATSASASSSEKIKSEGREEKPQGTNSSDVFSTIMNLKPVKRTGPGPMTKLIAKAPGLGLIQLKKVTASKSDNSLVKKNEVEAAQVKLKRTRPSDPLLNNSKDKPLLVKQKTEIGNGVKMKKTPTAKTKQEQCDSAAESGESKSPSRPSKNGRRPREHVIQIEVLSCAGPEEAQPGPEQRDCGRLEDPGWAGLEELGCAGPDRAEPGLRRLRQALRTLSGSSSRSAPSSPYASRSASPERRPAGRLLRSWHSDRLRAGAWTGPTLLDFVAARLEEAASWHRREHEHFRRLLAERRPLAARRGAGHLPRGPLFWTRLGCSVSD